VGRKLTRVAGNRPLGGVLEVDATPPSPFRLPRGSADGTLRIESGVATRLLHVGASPVLVRAWQPAPQRVLLRAEALDPERVGLPLSAALGEPAPAGERELAIAVERMRFALAVDDDLGEFHCRFRRDPLLGPLIRRMPWFRPKRQPWPWEALAWAVVGQLIESDRAARIQRRLIGRWGARLQEGSSTRRDVPPAAAIAGRAPAELESMDLAGSRAVALAKVAREVASGRCQVASGATDRRLLAIPQIGPWTVQCLGLIGRGELDSLPAGDLGYIKLVGRLAGHGRRATIEEVEAFYARFEPFRGLAGSLTLAGLHRAVAVGPPLRRAA
jgi:3-methyladenine DNA glycosylase/8-oxoguanine DNA glycosylase